jgi:hypothetical protein
MKTTVILMTLLVLTASFTRAEDWTTTDGKTYRNAKALSHDAGYVTIMYADGGARVALATLPPDLQKRFGYNPTQAAAVVATTTAADKRDHAALTTEDQAVEANRKKAQTAQEAQRQAALQPPPVTVSSAAPGPRAPLLSNAPAQNQGPAVDVFANTLQITKDQEELDSVKVDLEIAVRREKQGSPYGTGNQGSTSGPETSSYEHVAALERRCSDLTKEIKKLQAENKAAVAK